MKQEAHTAGYSEGPALKAPKKEGKTKRFAAALSLISNAFIMTGMILVGIFTGSMGVLSEGLHTGIDVISSCIAYFAVRKSSQPADKSHPFGHGKFEDASGFAEAVLIVAVAAFLIQEAVANLIYGTETLSYGLLFIAMIAAGATALIKFAVSFYQMRVAKRTDSIALESDAWHLRLDCLSSAGVFAGLLLIQITHLTWIDSVLAIIIAVCILPEAFLIIKKAFVDLMDGSLGKADTAEIEEIVARRSGDTVSCRVAKTRRAGPDKYAEISLVLPQNMPLSEAHVIASGIKTEIADKIPRISVTVCFEPQTEDAKQ